MLWTIAVVALAAVASADLKPWKKAGRSDSRSPCPMLNTLANHGYLPHNGRNLTVHHFGDAVADALNADRAYGEKPASIFVRGSDKTYFDLEDLNQPGILQHAASLSRDDVTAKSANIKASSGRIKALLADSDGSHVTAESIAKTRLRVEALSKPYNLTMKEQLLAYVEASLVLMMMMDEPVPSAFSFPSAKKWTAPKDRVRVWLSEERLPADLGWKRSERKLKAQDLLPAMKAIWDQKRRQSTEPPFWKAWVPSFLARDEL